MAQSVASKTKLEYLNELLRKNADVLGLPQFRSQVSTSGANQDWLKKALRRHDNAPEEIVNLLDLPFPKLLDPLE